MIGVFPHISSRGCGEELLFFSFHGHNGYMILFATMKRNYFLSLYGHIFGMIAFEIVIRNFFSSLRTVAISVFFLSRKEEGEDSSSLDVSRVYDLYAGVQFC